MTSVKSHTPPTFVIVLFAAASTSLVGILNAAWQGGWSLDGALAATRITARLSFLWFIAVWSASALAFHWPSGWRRTLLMRRRAIGLGFAAAHGVHLIALSLALGYFGHVSSALAIYGGGFCYVVIFAMAATSNTWGIKTLGAKAWKGLHVFGGLFAAGVFTNSYVGRIEDQPLVASYGLTIMAVAIGLQLSKALRGQKMRVSCKPFGAAPP